MSRVSLQNVSVIYGQTLFQDLSFSFGAGDHIGIVGNNGAGKSTLLKCIAGLVEPTAGVISVPRSWRIEYVDQDIPANLLEMSLQQAATSALSEDDRHAHAWRADVVLGDFGAGEELMARNVGELSGGWQRLAMLARAWVADPDLLVVDEPTNHLDLAKIVMLETWFKEQLSNTAVAVVSHDRRFLDRCTTTTLFIRPSESRYYGKPYSRAREILLEDDRAIELKRDRDQRELGRLQKSAHELRQIGVNKHSEDALRKSIQIAKRAEAIKDAMPDGHTERRRDITLSRRDTHAKRLIGLKDVVVESPAGHKLFAISNLDINQGDRVVVLGRNGTGKTCFVQKLRIAFNEPGSARQQGVQIAPSTVVGYIDQHMSQLPRADSLRDYINGAFKTGDQRATSVLAQSGFSFDQQTTKIGMLSPGEMSRLAFLALRLTHPSFYLMDEPTNNLDIAGQESLETEILDSAATAIIVSHDRAFVENVGTRFLVIEGARLLEIDRPHPFYQSLINDELVSQLAPKVVVR
ncbi:ATP-binding cassette domain-containing protein [Mesorhizobium sp. M1060]|uniref:ABC-F family ATP-binding cassette domain-containing protein n=1 Tax=Mesorhizobium sp. M1060 TaxID=2957052 RepID=UPI00333C20F2